MEVSASSQPFLSLSLFLCLFLFPHTHSRTNTRTHTHKTTNTVDCQLVSLRFVLGQRHVVPQEQGRDPPKRHQHGGIFQGREQALPRYGIRGEHSWVATSLSLSLSLSSSLSFYLSLFFAPCCILTVRPLLPCCLSAYLFVCLYVCMFAWCCVVLVYVLRPVLMQGSGELFDVLCAAPSERFDEATARVFFGHVLSGLMHLHRSVAHSLFAHFLSSSLLFSSLLFSSVLFSPLLISTNLPLALNAGTASFIATLALRTSSSMRGASRRYVTSDCVDPTRRTGSRAR